MTVERPQMMARLVPQPGQNTSSQGVPASSAARIVGDHNMSRYICPMPFRPDGYIPPYIPTRAVKPPAGPDWVHKIKGATRRPFHFQPRYGGSDQQLLLGLLQNSAKAGCAFMMTMVTAPAERTNAIAARAISFFLMKISDARKMRPILSVTRAGRSVQRRAGRRRSGSALPTRMAVRIALVFRADIVGTRRDGAQDDAEQQCQSDKTAHGTNLVSSDEAAELLCAASAATNMSGFTVTRSY
jgi:hypothetical protein